MRAPIRAGLTAFVAAAALGGALVAPHAVGAAKKKPRPRTVDVADNYYAPARLTVGKGSVVHFANDETYVHHAFVDTPDFKADTGDIPPGERRDIVFTRAGTYTIRCAIHPQMKLVVEVTEKE